MNTLTKMPYRGRSMLDDFDELWNGFFAPAGNPLSQQRDWLPAMDIVENETGYVVRTDLPGVKKEDLSVNVRDKTLVIEAKTDSEQVEKEGEAVVRRERRSGTCRRSLRLGNEIDETAIAADYTDGVLTLTLPKTKVEPASRAIDISAG